MEYFIRFERAIEESERPLQEIQEEPLRFKDGEFIPLPAVGDSLDCTFDGKRKPYRVISRHFSYQELSIGVHVTIVV